MSSDSGPSDRRERDWLGDIVENIDRIESYLAGTEMAALQADPMRRDAIERCLQRITEAVIRIGETRMAEIAPALSARAVRGLGNILRHEYHRIDLRIIAATVTNDLPGLRAACAAALDR